MVINRSSWHFKLFEFMANAASRMFTFLCYRQLLFPEYVKTIDLCSYLRTIFFTGPLTLALTIGFYGWIFYVLLWWPMHHSGYAVIGLLKIVLAIILVVITFVVIGCLVDKYLNKKEEDEEKSVVKDSSKAGMWTVLKESYKGWKSKICPIAELE